MNEVLALFVMFVIGLVCLRFALWTRPTQLSRWLFVMAVLFGAPPLVRLWVMGVMG